MVERNYILITVMLLSLIGWNAYGGDIDKSKVNKVKAGLLYNMTKMITWPENSFIDDEPISILFLGKDYNEIGSYFESQVRSRSLTLKGRKILVKQLAKAELNDVVRKEVKKCHILFIISSYKGSILKLLHAIGKKPVLLVGESSSFLLEGGMVGLSIEKKHVGISVNLDAVNNSDLKISAQLLQHAKIVKKEQ